MQRRKFLKTAIAGTVAIATGNLIAADSSDKVSSTHLDFLYHRSNITGRSNISNRQQRYREYCMLLDSNSYLDAQIQNIIFEAMRGGVPLYSKYSFAFDLAVYGDAFVNLPWYLERAILPCKMYRIETVKRGLLEFQEGYDGPDYMALVNNRKSNTVTRYRPCEILHMKFGSEFYPYGTSLLEPIRKWASGKGEVGRIKEEDIASYKRVLRYSMEFLGA